MLGKLHVGTGGWSFPHWRNGAFYPSNIKADGEFFYFGSRKFNSVELNNTFHRQPKKELVDKWKAAAKELPTKFVYSVKMNQRVTHELQFDGAGEALKFFFENICELGPYLGCVLFQTPPTFSVDCVKLQSLVNHIPAGSRVAFEFRHASWFCPEVFDILRANNWSLVIFSHPKIPCPKEVTADYVYLRFHGPNELHASSYSQKQLNEWASFTHDLRQKGVDIYAYFNADIDCCGPKDGAVFRKAVRDLAGEEDVLEKSSTGQRSIASFFGAAASKRPAPSSSSSSSSNSSAVSPKKPKKDILIDGNAPLPLRKVGSSASSAAQMPHQTRTDRD